MQRIGNLMQTLTRSRSRTVLTVFCVALIARCIVASVIAITENGSLFQDDYYYLEIAKSKAQPDPVLPNPETLVECELIDGDTYCIRLVQPNEDFSKTYSDPTAQHLVGCRDFAGDIYCQRGGWSSQKEYVWNSTKSLLLPITILFKLFGPHPIFGQLLVSLSGAIAVAGVAFLISQATSKRTALLFGLIFALYPSQILWSSIVLKDSFICMTLILIAVLFERWETNSIRRWNNCGNVCILLIITTFLCYLRITALVIACIACFIATVWKSTHSRMLRTAATLLILLLLPLLSPGGRGPLSAGSVTWSDLAGISLLTDGIPDLEGRRHLNAQGANTAVVAAPESLVLPMDLQCATRTNEETMTLVPDPCGEPGTANQQPSSVAQEASLAAQKALTATREASLAAEEASLAAEEAAEEAVQEALTAAQEASLAAREASLAAEEAAVAAQEAAKSAQEAAEEASLAAEEASFAAEKTADEAAREASLAAQEAAVTAHEVAVAAHETSLMTQTTPEVTLNNRILEELRHLPVGLRVMLLDPMPSHLNRSTSLRYPFIEHLLWYPILVLALIGLVRNRFPTSTLTYSLLVLLGSAAMWGAVEGNFGAAYRHRTEFAWVAILFAATGFHHLVETRTKGRPNPPHQLVRSTANLAP